MSQKRSDRKKCEEIIMVEYFPNLIKAIKSAYSMDPKTPKYKETIPRPIIMRHNKITANQ